MSTKLPLLLKILIKPDCLPDLDDSEWDLLVRQARASSLLGQIYYLVIEGGYLEGVPDMVRHHLVSENRYFEAQKKSVLWEIDNISGTLAHLDTPIILLKGAAYLKKGYNVSRGRIFNDIDILVRQDQLDRIEAGLKQKGWFSTHLNEYDQRYYRKWMHEIPPLKHSTRGTVLDIHHTILPLTSSNRPDIAKMFDASEPLENKGNIRVLSKTDMFIHSATHLFHESELSHALRDLVDLRLLAEEQGSELFCNELTNRAKELDLSWPVSYALYYLKTILQYQPAECSHDHFGGKEEKTVPLFLVPLFTRAFMPNHHSCTNFFSHVASWLLYIRGHWLRMPFYLLIPHLVRKALARDKE